MKEITFKKLKKIFSNELNLLTPVFASDFQFTAIYFQMNSLEEELNIFRAICQTTKNITWALNEQTDFKYFYQFKEFSISHSSKIERVYKCKYSNSNNFHQNCKFKNVKYSYFDHKILGINCGLYNLFSNFSLNTIKGLLSIEIFILLKSFC